MAAEGGMTMPEQMTKEELQALFAMRRFHDIESARQAGQLARLLGASEEQIDLSNLAEKAAGE